MFNILRKIFKTGLVTRLNPFKKPPKKFRGKILVNEENCDGSKTCVHVCPAEAIRFRERENGAELTFDYSKCMSCGLCAEFCPSDALVQSNETIISTRDPAELVETFLVKKPAATRRGEH